MRSDEPNLNIPEIRWLDEAGFQARARAIASHFIRRYQLSTATADDLYQVVMLKLIRYSRSGGKREIERPLALFYAVAHNEARRILSEERGHVTFSKERGDLSVSLEDVPPAAFSDKLKDAQRIVSNLLLKELVEGLNEEERLIFDYWSQGYSTRQIAGLMQNSNTHISHVTVASRLERIMEQIRKLLFQEENPGRTL